MTPAPQDAGRLNQPERPHEAERLTRPEVAELMRQTPVAILPLGATEQHGPHLPLGTDSFLAQEVARRLAAATGALLFPPIPVGYSWVWRDIPGTLTLDEATLEQVIKDIAHGLHRQGFKTLILVGGHEANNAAMKYAVRELADEIPMRVLYFFYPGLEAAAAGLIESPTWHGMIHACELETSLLLAARPELCHMDRAVREYPAKPADYGHSARSLGSLSESGVFGDATLATAEKGERLLNAVVARLVELVSAIQAEP
ncbi:MAG: creatininase family protein [Symbiobacteriia bacterium]